MIKDAIEIVVAGDDLSGGQVGQVMAEIMDGTATPAQFGAFVVALRQKGETPEEIAGMARVMRERSLHVDAGGSLVDTCGTGGDGSGSFNISTTSAFVVAGAGVKVAKHGNRAMSSGSGSADVLEALGAKIDLGPRSVEQCLKRTGFGFMFAQRFHPSMKFAAGPRREIGIRTVFNILGPLTNPAGATSQLIGVADPALAPTMARVLGLLGSKHALVVHGEGGFDEITLAGASQIWELVDGDIREYTVTPGQMGLDAINIADIRVDGPDESADILRTILAGHDGPARDVVLANAAAALLAADRVSDLKEGVALAARSIDDGEAATVMESFVALSQTLD
jgi:anthranilate phosphoribosyltransferase